MSEKEFIPCLRLAHGLFNIAVFLLGLYQARLGWKVRTLRQTSTPAVKFAKRHRRLGPLLFISGISGFMAGVVLVSFDKGRILEYPLHFFTGLVIASGLGGMFLISKKITAAETFWRTVHFRLGLAILALYALQILLGLGILL